MRKRCTAFCFYTFILLISLFVSNQYCKANDEEGYYFLDKWGSYGSELGQFILPTGVAVDIQGNVYVVDENNGRIQKFSNSGTLITCSTEPADCMWVLRDLTVDNLNNVFTIFGHEFYYHSILKFNSDIEQRILSWGVSGNIYDLWNYEYLIPTYGPELSGCVFRPGGLTSDNFGNIYVADTGNNRIQKFDSSGNFINKWGVYGTGDGEFISPSDIAVDSSGSIYVVDSGNNRIQKFDSSGNFINKWGVYGTGDGEFISPSYIAVDNSGSIYVVDSGNNRIQKFNDEGGFTTQWGSFGSENMQFNNPHGIAVDNEGNVYVADYGNNCIKKFSNIEKTLPVILIYGWHGSEKGTWSDIPSWLNNDGFSVNIFEYNTANSIDTSSQLLSQFIEEVCDPDADGNYEYEQVNIVAHSMGGLVSRYYIEKLGGEDKVDKLIMLGTPNHGSILAESAHPVIRLLNLFGVSDSAISTGQMCPDSSFLSLLNTGFSASDVNTKYAIIAGTGHLSGVVDIPTAVFTGLFGSLSYVLEIPSIFLVGPDDGAVQVSSAQLPGVAIYCVDKNHIELTKSLSVYENLVKPILYDVSVDTSLYSPPSYDSANNLPVPTNADYHASFMNQDEFLEGTFEVTSDSISVGEMVYIMESTYCDLRTTLTTPTGQIVNPEIVDELDWVNYVSDEHNWRYEVINPEVGDWSYRVEAIEVPEQGTDVQILLISLPVVVPDMFVVPEYPFGTLLPVIIGVVALIIFNMFRFKRRNDST